MSLNGSGKSAAQITKQISMPPFKLTCHASTRSTTQVCLANISKYHWYLAYIPVNKRSEREWWKYQGYLIVQELDHANANSRKLSASHLLDISQIQHQRGQMKVQAVHGKYVLQSGDYHWRSAKTLKDI